MYYYAPDENKKGKRAGLAALCCYVALFLASSFLVSFQMDYDPSDEGILIDFGTDDEGNGSDNVSLQQEELPSAASTASAKEYVTQNMEEAPALNSISGNRDEHRNEDARHNANNESGNPSSAQVREINRKALFPGRSSDSEALSQGKSANTQGNAGKESGSDGSISGTGSATEGISFDLKGRNPIGSLPRPSYESNDAQGIVIVEITVDAEGRVQTATFRPHGSTTQDTKLLEAALKAARQAKFTPNESNALQTGSITYVFRLQ